MVAAVVSDLMTFSRISSVAEACGASVIRLDSPADLPGRAEVDLVLVDWADRADDWAGQLDAWRSGPEGPRLILFGPHVDLEAHDEAKRLGLGPMWARSRLVRELPQLIRSGPAPMR